VERPWIDGGLDVLQGVVRVFNPPSTACYECTMSQVDWDLLNRRRSCSLLARRAVAERGTPTTPSIASIIGALQVQEMVKLLHGMEALLGRGFVFEGLRHSSYVVSYPVDPNCPWHEAPARTEHLAAANSDTPLSEIAQYASERLGGLDALDLSRELVSAMQCPACGTRQEVFQTAEKVTQVLCRKCGTEAAPDFFHSLPAGSPWLARSARQLGLPPWDIVWTRHQCQTLAIELAGDSPFRMATTNAGEKQLCPG
jgi:adenylyltransferase/sulfurtransferase